MVRSIDWIPHSVQVCLLFDEAARLRHTMYVAHDYITQLERTYYGRLLELEVAQLVFLYRQKKYSIFVFFFFFHFRIHWSFICFYMWTMNTMSLVRCCQNNSLRMRILTQYIDRCPSRNDDGKYGQMQSAEDCSRPMGNERIASSKSSSIVASSSFFFSCPSANQRYFVRSVCRNAMSRQPLS